MLVAPKFRQPQALSVLRLDPELTTVRSPGAPIGVPFERKTLGGSPKVEPVLPSMYVSPTASVVPVAPRARITARPAATKKTFRFNHLLRSLVLQRVIGTLLNKKLPNLRAH